MNNSANTRMPSGFAGAISGLSDLEPEGQRVLRLPAHGITDGPFLQFPDTPFDAVVLTGITESMGNLQRFLSRLAATLPPGGGIVVDFANMQSPATLHQVLEGAPGSYDPIGSLRDPERPVLLANVLEALSTAGFVVSDCISVPSAVSELGPSFAQSMFDEGFLASTCINQTPPARYWITAKFEKVTPGTVLIGAGTDADQRHTEAAIQSFLPDGWQTLRCSGDTELESFNRGIAQARSELIWFLRAGTSADRTLFDNLVARTLIGPALPEAAEEFPGGMCGLMCLRQSVLLTGPLPRNWDTEQVAFEEFGLRLAARSQTPATVEGDLTCPPGPRPSATRLAEESRELVECWEPLLNQPFRGERITRVQVENTPEPPWGEREPTITLCMIARNEASMLPECLQSARGAVDEIIIVDTGSTDATVEIAEAAGAKVIHTTWADDFATPRNLGLEAATSDWILVLDADERLEESAPERIRELIRDPGVSGYHMIMRNVYDGGRTQGVRMVRMFRNIPGARYENRIHEQITPSLATAAARENLTLSSSDIVIEHIGYRDEIVKSRDKDARNERIFRLELREKPNDIYTLYKFGDFLRRLPERRDECLEILELALECVFGLAPHEHKALPYAAEIAALCALEHARDDRAAEAEAVIERALSSLIPTPNLHYIAAGLALCANRNDEAIAHYKRCLGYADQVLVVPIQEGITSHVSITGIAHAWLQKGDHAQAQRLLEQSLRICPSYEVSALALSRLHFERKNFNDSVRVLTDYLVDHPDSAGACQQATLILHKLGLVDQARSMGDRAVGLLEKASLTKEAQRMRDTVAALA